MPATDEPKKKCARCKDVKPLTDFTKNKRMADGLTDYCRPCHRAANKQSRINTIERLVQERIKELQFNLNGGK